MYILLYIYYTYTYIQLKMNVPMIKYINECIMLMNAYKEYE